MQEFIRINISEIGTVHPPRLYPESSPHLKTQLLYISIHYLPVSPLVVRQAPELSMRIMLPFNRLAICHHITYQLNRCCLGLNKIQMLKICPFHQET